MRTAITLSVLLAVVAAVASAAELTHEEFVKVATAALARSDPTQAEALGRERFNHQFTAREGAGAAAHPTMRAAQAQACIVCHNVPYGEAGAGATIGRSGPTGRSTPHVFGVTMLEQLAAAITSELMRSADLDHDGTISLAEGDGRRALIDPDGDGPAPAIDFGQFIAAGAPALDPAVRVWLVAPDGQRLPAARALADPGVAGFRFVHGPFGWTAADGEDPRATASLRGFIVGAFAAHAGLEVDDPGLAEVAFSGFSAAEAQGTRPLYMGGVPDPGIRRDAHGRSVDDPDGDGIAAELTAADVDVVAAFLRGLPQPAERKEAFGFNAGRATFSEIGCTSCHVADWNLAGVKVVGLYSDLRHHDLGAACHQVRFDGGITTRFRTPPLWGVGTSAPYGHDGASLDLDAVIRRHGGESASVTLAYVGLTDEPRERLLAFLRALVLVPTQKPGGANSRQ